MDRPVRLLEVVDSLQPGGMENVLVQVISGYDPSRLLTEVVCLTRGGPFEARLPGHVKVHVIGKSEGFQWETARRLRRIVRSGSFDVVHTHHLGGLIFFALARGFRRHPVLMHSEHMLWSGEDMSRKRLWQRRLLYPLAAAITTVSQQQLDQMRALGFHHRRMFAIINGVDSARFRPAEDKTTVRRRLELDPGARWLGMVARFGPQKRHLALIEAFERMAPICEGANLLLVGDGGPEKERVLARLEASPMKSRLRWVGFQSDPVPWYQAMDVLVISSSNEGMPNAVLEAMSCGVPIMANDVCGVREIATDDVHGWIRDLGTVEKLAGGLLEVGVAPLARLAALGAEARGHVVRNFSMDIATAKYRDLLLGGLY